MSDDWEVVKEALGGPYVSDEGPALISMPNMIALVAALARLREREAQLLSQITEGRAGERELRASWVEQHDRAEAAEAHVAELGVNLDSKMDELRAAEARVAELTREKQRAMTEGFLGPDEARKVQARVAELLSELGEACDLRDTAVKNWRDTESLLRSADAALEAVGGRVERLEKALREIVEQTPFQVRAPLPEAIARRALAHEEDNQ